MHASVFCETHRRACGNRIRFLCRFRLVLKRFGETGQHFPDDFASMTYAALEQRGFYSRWPEQTLCAFSVEAKHQNGLLIDHKAS